MGRMGLRKKKKKNKDQSHFSPEAAKREKREREKKSLNLEKLKIFQCRHPDVHTKTHRCVNTICACLISPWRCIYRYRWNLKPQSQTKFNYQISNISMNMPPRPSFHPASFTSSWFDYGHSDLTFLISITSFTKLMHIYICLHFAITWKRLIGRFVFSWKKTS